MECVSVVVPVYNAEKYLKRCVQSLLDQTYSNIQIILVNDGSLDNSAELCNRFSDLSKNVVVIHQDNSGVTAARNRGIEASTGDYITFVDSDDWIDKDFIETAINSFRNNPTADICVEKMYADHSDGKVEPIGIIGEDNLFSQREAVEEMVRFTFFRWELCGKVYRRNLFDSYKADESISMCEDLDSNWILFHKARNIYYTGKSVYHYYVNEFSATRAVNFLKDTTLTVYDRILNSSKEVPYDVKMRFRRDSIIIIARKVREMYFQGISQYEDEVEKLLLRFRELINIFTDMKSGLYDVLKQDRLSCDRIFAEEFEKVRLAVDKAKRYSKIYIYGTGVAAEYLLRSFSQDEQEKVAFVVSDAVFSEKRFCFHKVYRLSEIEPEDDSVIVMSIQDKVRPVVVEDLKKRGFEHIIEFSMRNIYIRL